MKDHKAFNDMAINFMPLLSLGILPLRSSFMKDLYYNPARASVSISPRLRPTFIIIVHFL